MAKTLEQKLKEWNKDPERHLYRCYYEYNRRYVDNGNEEYYTYEGVLKSCDIEHAYYLMINQATNNGHKLGQKPVYSITLVA